MSKRSVLMSSDGDTFNLKVVDEVPPEAELDNYVEADGVEYDVFAMPGTKVMGRTFVLETWCDNNDNIESLIGTTPLEAGQ